jgi:hypothetical protein
LERYHLMDEARPPSRWKIQHFGKTVYVGILSKQKTQQGSDCLAGL